jgi:hypothetical protein
MNIRWFKQNIVLVVIVAVFLLALGAILWSVQQATSHKNQIVTELEDQQNQLQSLRSQPVFPSKENIDTVKRDREQVAKLYEMLRKAVTLEPMKVADFQSSILFAQHMRETLGELADDARRNQVKTPDAFAFGFSRYNDVLPCTKPPINEEECRKILTQLAEQLTVVQKLSKLILGSGIEELTHIRRVDVEPGQPGTDALFANLKQEPNALLKTQPLEVQFICDTKALRTVLNNLSKSDWLFPVRSLRLEPSGGSTASSAPTAPAAPGRPGMPEPVKPVERTRLQVTMRVDLIEVAPEPVKEKPQT